MANILLGAEGSGVEQRRETAVAVCVITVEDIKDNSVANIATQYHQKDALFYINSLIGLRRAEIDLFFTIRENFDGVCAVIDRAESVTADDRKVIQDDICQKLGLGEENIYFVKKSDPVSDLIKIGLKFKKSSDIVPAAKITDAVKRNSEAESNAYDENDGDEDDDDMKDVFLPAMAAMGVFITVLSALYYVAESFSGGPHQHGKKSVFTFIYSAAKYLAVFIGTVAVVLVYKKVSDREGN
ncbi:MAG: hypothetical protein A2008_06505 [Candidatus Wallbacteria bacterium GWC2_49_35]|uniref:Uncharacterized protein n=1 Tax=Candidatus Wallbacteria bacterium GWC2_49_35 TaxID=1817813 RepID=A0A1F7WMK0_9BACT|nr:MAG: hypothetical protein A2008_06505 [Candidatus Wallbacteria bacterium GWC2_49_35]HBC76405.1 hypothetical protein [Candidatus Wallbacteria bacterium]